MTGKVAIERREANMLSWLKWMCVWCVLILMCGGASCASQGDDDSGERGTDHNDDRTLPQSTSERVPSDAESVAEGTGRLEYKADAGGKIYVYDVDRREVVYSGEILDGDILVFDAPKNRATINGRTVLDQDLKKKDRYRIYLLSSRHADREDRDYDVPSGIPSAASRVEHGEGTLSYTATRNGTVYVYDSDDKRVVTDVRVERDDRVRLVPDDDELSVNGKVVSERDLKQNHKHELYFDRD